MELNTLATIATIICAIPVVWGGLVLIRRFVKKVPSDSDEEASRWDEIQESLRSFRPYFRGENGRYLVGLRVPNTTPKPFTVRKVVVTTTNSRNFLLNLLCHVQLDGTAVQGDGKPSWTLPCHLAGLWEMPGDGNDQKDLTIGQVSFEIEFEISSGASCLHKLQLNATNMSEETRGFLEWGKTMRDIDGHTITQSTIDGNVDMKLTKPSGARKDDRPPYPVRACGRALTGPVI